MLVAVIDPMSGAVKYDHLGMTYHNGKLIDCLMENSSQQF